MIKKELQKRILSSIILLPLALYFILSGSYYLIFFTLIGFFISIYEWNKMVKKIELKFLGTIFIVFSFYTFYQISITYFWIYILLICISTDIGGYVFGKLFKGPKLTSFSPNKTFAGMLGGFIMSILSMFIFTYTYGNQNLSINLSVFVIIISLISQLGDITISFFKRLANIKDTGKIIPGHGGLLDRIDGMIFAFPFSNILIFINFY